MTDWLQALVDCRARGEPACLVSVAEVRGSAPREPGARMLVTASRTWGTIGGGQLEYQCTRLAADAIGANGAQAFDRRFPLGTNCGQCCGGVVDVIFEPLAAIDSNWLEQQQLELRGSEFRIALFGAGHVGSAVVDVLSRLECQLRWIDSRPNFFPENLPHNVNALTTDCPAREVSAMPAASFYLVMTHSHALDFEITDQVLRRGDAAYCGLIGSLSKRRRFERLMRQQGLPDAQLARLVCPIGVAGIDGKKPQEIAVSTAAELLRIRDQVQSNSDTSKQTLRAL